MRSKYSKKQVIDAAKQCGLDIQFKGQSVQLYADAVLLYEASQGQRLEGAMAVINTYLKRNQSMSDIPGSSLPVTYRNQLLTSDGATIQERFYDTEIPYEVPVRDPKQGSRLQEMFTDGGILDAAINEIVDSSIASSDGDDRGWIISDEIEGKPINPAVAVILDRLYSEVIGGNKLVPAFYQLLMFGDAFASIGIEFGKDRLGRIGGFDWLPTYEMFRVEREVKEDDQSKKEIYFEQRRYLSDEHTIQIPYLACVHWRFRYKGRKYGNALFAGDACYRAWQSLREAEMDLQKASRNVGISPIKHIFPSVYSDKQKQNYRLEIERKRQRDGAITDFYLTEGGDISGVNLNPSLDGLIAVVEYWRKVLAVQSRVPPFLLGVSTDAAKDIAQQPALSYSRLINSLRADITTGIRHFCDLELMLHGLNPSDPQNQYRILWPKIVVNAFDTPDMDESQAIPDMEADVFEKAKHAYDVRQQQDRSAIVKEVYKQQRKRWDYETSANN